MDVIIGPEITRAAAQADAERHLAERGSRTTPARAKALLSRLGTPGDVRPDDRLDAPDDAEAAR